MNVDIKKGENMFFVGEDELNPEAFVSYVVDEDGDFIIDSTQVANQLSGQGIGSALVNMVVEYAKEEDKRIVPACPFARAVMEREEDSKKMIK
ncbi:GNAT family N-acetyltransferase [Salinicoccus halitifaciens]|uniref:GNAT family acetyltransferase n=1 Tax=Salinicoccus halitifaciens TaxID=1073415 RepID=A0ABV2E6Z2_9STAP|nr:GNAT family N-acetyltransferase [Salinicoccus halitifaciens]MCD2136852.1 N-acetyltransferase [Salinicoccus halitifaciens]